MNDREKLKNHLFDIFTDIFHANNDHKKCDFYWVLGLKILYILYDNCIEHDALPSLFGIKIKVDMVNADTVMLCKIMYGGTYEG